MAEAINIVMDLSDPPTAKFVEIERLDGTSVKIGEWDTREDGFGYLKITVDDIRSV